MFTEDAVPSLHCGDCMFFNVRADLPGEASYCKRIDHKLIKFAIPWFACYDCNAHSGMICADFQPRHPELKYIKDWESYENYITVYRDGKSLSGYVWFTINSDTTVRYGVPVELFVYGGMIEGDILKATQKMCYKTSRKSPIGYELITEDIDGVKVEGLSKLNKKLGSSYEWENKN